jgi:diaminopimelate decarboxylase
VQTERAGLKLGGSSAEVLAQTYGTPLLVIDTDVLDASIARFAALGTELGIDVAYAGKALLIVALARRLAATPLALDVCSLGELLTAERAGFPAARIVMHGCGKTDDELAAAVAGRVGRLVIDNREELERLARIARAERPLAVLLRINPGIEAHTHAYVRTSGEDSKFGFARDEIAPALERIAELPGLRADGLHAHLGSQLLEPEPYLAALSILLDVYAGARASGAPLREIIMGGGFGIDNGPAGETLDAPSTLRALAERLAGESRARNLPAPRLGIEPGRAIVAEAGTSLYRVLALKRRGERRFAIVDGSLADNPRPALYGAFHRPELANRPASRAPETFTLAGRSCENDELVTADLPGDLRDGDLVALRTTGAYTYSMASNYNRFPRPAVVFAGGGIHALVARRETAADTLRNDVEDAGAP